MTGTFGLAIKIHGLDCTGCGFNFEKKYGVIGKSYIQIHHCKSLYVNSREIEVDPEKDLIPVCSNCHCMIHRRKHQVYSIEEIKKNILY